ncbi:MAG: DUF1127 domain-containing protein [Alphaproteobacteria bacterium]|nr:DUF1127 domain-containing protein [Alphaproteobacteria bacterium]
MHSRRAPLIRRIRSRIALWQKRRRDLAELSTLDDRSLADIGITRSDIPYIVYGRRVEQCARPIQSKPASRQGLCRPSDRALAGPVKRK